MKVRRRLYLCSITLLVILAILSVPVVPVLALTGSFNISVLQAAVGTQVRIWGDGFTEDSYYIIHFGDRTLTPVDTDNIVQSGGVFDNYFIVPDMSAGFYSVWVTTEVDTSVSKSFKIISEPRITISSTSGYVGDQVTVSGSGFTADSSAQILFDDSSAGSSVSIGSTGNMPNTVITIPDARSGSHTISARDSSGTVAPSLTYTVSPKMTVSSVSGGVGDQVVLSGNGFAASQSLGVYFDSVIMPAQAMVTSAQGGFSNLVFTIPSSSRGDHIIKVQAGSSSATATFAVGQKVTVSPETGPPGTVVTVSGTGFTPYQVISVRLNSVPVVTTPSLLSALYDGSFSGSFTVSGAAGTYLVAVSDGIITSSRSFTTVITGSMDPIQGNVGTDVTVSGTGFVPNSLVIVKFDGVEVASANVAANGAVTAAFKAPAVRGGSYQVVATDSVNAYSATFTMEAVAPAVPGLLLPEDKTSAGRAPVFDWEDVTDPSDVTYNFQMSTNSDFSNLLYDEKELTDSGFSIDKADKLESASKDEPYYWRVKAVDGAFNESDWTAAASFYTGFTFNLPTWAIYTLIGFGALLIGILGFWMGRRTAYY